jgi:hypothetical protein
MEGQKCFTPKCEQQLRQGILKGKYHCNIFLQVKTKNVSCHTANSKPVKQKVNGTVIIPPLVFPGLGFYSHSVKASQRISYFAWPLPQGLYCIPGQFKNSTIHCLTIYL